MAIRTHQILLQNSARACGTPEFEAILKLELAQAGINNLPLQQGLSTGNYVADTPISLILIKWSDFDKIIKVKAGIYFTGLISGCSCADDPGIDGETNEYCEVEITIDKMTSMATVDIMN